MLGEADPSLLEGWHAGFETVPVAALPSPIQEIYLLSPSIPAVEGIVAQVTIAYPDLDISHDFTVRGAVAADGRFALEEVGLYGNERIAIDLSYDHKALYVGQQGASFYSAYLNSREDTVVNLETLGATALPLVDWVRGPFAVSRYPAIQRTTSFATVEVEGRSMDVLQLTEAMPGSGLEGTRVYDLQMVESRTRPANTGRRPCSRKFQLLGPPALAPSPARPRPGPRGELGDA